MPAYYPRRRETPQPWSAMEDGRLIHLYELERLGPREIAQKLHRSVGSVRSRMTTLRARGELGPARGHGGRRCSS